MMYAKNKTDPQANKLAPPNAKMRHTGTHRSNVVFAAIAAAIVIYSETKGWAMKGQQK